MISIPVRRGGPKLLQQLRQALRLHHYSRRTEEAYVGWVRRYVRFHGLRHPRELGQEDIRRFLTALAVRGLSASSQTQALSALVFLYREVLCWEPGDLGELVRAKQPGRLPVVLTREEVRGLLDRLEGIPRVVYPPVWQRPPAARGARAASEGY
jgi:site-specific recombinase XerD